MNRPAHLGTVGEWLQAAAREDSEKREASPASRALYGVLYALGSQVQPASAQVFARLGQRLACAVEEGHSAWPLAQLSLEEQALVAAPHPLVGQGDTAAPSALLNVAYGCVAFAWQASAERRLARRFEQLAQQQFTRATSAASQAPLLNAQQSQAVALAGTRALAIITGGPGTGKTTCLTHLLAQHLQAQPDARIALAAPTGKAAARMRQALQHGAEALADTAIAARILALQPTTLHRLLQPLPGGRGFRRNESNPVPCELLVVDECSMLDLPLADALLQALPPNARLVLLGDRDQLAAVEHGAVFHALAGGDAGRPALPQATVELTQSWRFDAHRALGLAADAVRRGDAAALDAVFDAAMQSDDTSLRWQAAEAALHDDAVLADVIAPWGEFLRELSQGADALRVLAAAQRFQMLCAVNEGPFGARELNVRIGRLLRRRGLGSLQASGHFHGRLVMATRNDAALGLANGDTGVVLDDGRGGLQACFAQTEGLLLRPAQDIDGLVDAFALSIHKAQGSEYDAIALVLPRADSPVLSRSLLYTGLTRARKAVQVLGSRDALHAALARPNTRITTLAARLLQRR